MLTSGGGEGRFSLYTAYVWGCGIDLKLRIQNPFKIILKASYRIQHLYLLITREIGRIVTDSFTHGRNPSYWQECVGPSTWDGTWRSTHSANNPFSAIPVQPYDMPIYLLMEDVDIPTWVDNAHSLPSRFPVISAQNLQVVKMQLSNPDAHYLRYISSSPDIRLNIYSQCLSLNGSAICSLFAQSH